MESAPQASETSTPANNDAEQRRRAVEVGSYIKKLLDAYRLLEPGHPSFSEIEEITWTKTSNYLKNFGELSMEISPTAISIEEKIVVEANRKTESVSFPLFSEGIHEILFGTMLTAEQLKGFLLIWAEACKQAQLEVKDETVSITTKVWESDFDAIELIALQTIQEGSETDADSEEQQDMRLAMNAIAGAEGEEGGTHSSGLIGGTGASGAQSFWTKAANTDGHLFRDRLNVDDQHALQLLSAELHFPIEGPHAQANYTYKSSVRLTESRLSQMKEELDRNWSQEHLAHYINSVFMLAFEANTDELKALVTSLSKVLSSRCEERSFELVYQALGMAQKNLLSKSDNPNYCYPIIETLLSAIGAPKVLEPTISGLEHPSTRDAAYQILGYLPASHVSELIKRLDRLSTPLGIDAMLTVISHRNPKTEDLALAASQCKPEIARAILKYAGKLRADDAHSIRRAVLCHPDPAIRMNILDSIQVEAVPANIEEIRSLLTDSTAGIRARAALLVVQVKDARSIAILSSIIAGEFEPEEKKRSIMGIARIGGTEAGLALRKVFIQQKNNELRCVTALGLGEMGDESARPLLEKEVNRVLARGQLKASCAEAIRRLDAFKNEPARKDR